jgi:hypothetical protein
MPLPTERKVFQFNHATVIYTAEHSYATSRVMPSLAIQISDEYRYQRELSVKLKHQYIPAFTEGNNTKKGITKIFWESHAYRHPGKRHVQVVTKTVAERFIERFLERVEKYPTLLFNDTTDRMARHEGFVHLHEKLLDGCDLTVKLLD